MTAWSFWCAERKRSARRTWILMSAGSIAAIFLYTLIASATRLFFW